VRDWHGVGHTVTVLEDGFHYDERHWPSLTAIARQITGAKCPALASLASPEAPCEAGALCGLHPQVDRGWARAGVQQPPCPARGVRGLYPQPEARRMGARADPL
jgi:hypothetical protein